MRSSAHPGEQGVELGARGRTGGGGAEPGGPRPDDVGGRGDQRHRVVRAPGQRAVAQRGESLGDGGRVHVGAEPAAQAGAGGRRVDRGPPRRRQHQGVQHG
ncbi:hypothetical protein, partial [Pseudonocardia sp. ICBG601]|uniref:hypothetical protein n=1 Tax=Pseudonocardia sp. ICBG601 TaxID=2846759 RepID=UPI0035ABC1E6